MSLYPDHWRCDYCDGNKRGGGSGFCSDECEAAEAEFNRDPAAAMAKTQAACAANLERMRTQS
ncbi:MAG: hypothetical protein H0U52_00610 [Chloroflexi bacterium]|nr:hypothetical protein [Chloroflexota bacterium]